MIRNTKLLCQKATQNPDFPVQLIVLWSGVFTRDSRRSRLDVTWDFFFLFILSVTFWPQCRPGFFLEMAINLHLPLKKKEWSPR